MAKLIDGKVISEQVLTEISEKVKVFPEENRPGLAVVLVGERKDSATYVRMKKRAAEKCGMHFIEKRLPDTISQEDLVREVELLNQDSKVHGIIVQLPLPSHINDEAVLSKVSLEKDVDGFHPDNIGRIGMRNRTALFTPCTPKGCMELLKRSGIEIAGKKAVVLGRSNIVGLPAALLLLKEDATVTVCHSRSSTMVAEMQQADIVVAALGKAEFVRKEWIKPGAVVIDVGINDVPDASKAAGYRLVGDVDFEGVRTVASAITPVPGGVGPMTVAMLLQNTLDAFLRTPHQ
eukprot:TRINITY_DN1536_c0_g1_i1.p1 TRINITY_DN1536_c0_g1~~TRINITY_DN1536_c0_g1_i1.p1  ORF type:complete len:291 (+),score=59.27 TRINITY_DN1536_c0_g1_i1:79-951(+)